jgi:hypothetical protein
MARWLAAVSMLLAVVTVGMREVRRAPDAKPLGGTCESTHGCQQGTRCVEQDGVLTGQCSASCSDNLACSERFGAAVLCLGVDLCARACAAEDQCPDDTHCNAYGWCERATAGD